MPAYVTSLVEGADTWLPLFALLAGISAILAVAVSNRRKRPHENLRPFSSRVGSVLLVLVLVDVVITQTQLTRHGVAAPMNSIPCAALMTWVHRLLVLSIPAVAVVCIALGVGERLAGCRVRMSAAMAALPFAGAWATSSVFGALSAANVHSWTAWAVFVALACLPVAGLLPIRQARALLRVLISGSLAIAVLNPSWAFTPYEVTPGGWRVDAARLQGLMAHPNQMGWLAAMAIPLEWSLARSKSARLACVSPAVLCLLLSGSRTVLFAVVVGCVFCVRPSKGDLTQWIRAGRLLRRAAMLAASAGLAFLFLDQSAQRDGGTLNGRTHYWDKAVQAWHTHPIIGTGPAADSNAHNQLLHSAAELGVVGLLALAWFTLRALGNIRSSPIGRHYALPALVVLVAIWTTEAPMRFIDLACSFPMLPAILLILAAQRPEHLVTPHSEAGSLLGEQARPRNITPSRDAADLGDQSRLAHPSPDTRVPPAAGVQAPAITGNDRC